MFSILNVPTPSPAAMALLRGAQPAWRMTSVASGRCQSISRVVWLLRFTLPVGWRRGERCVIHPQGLSRWRCLDPRCVKFSLCPRSPFAVLVYLPTPTPHRLHPLLIWRLLSTPIVCIFFFLLHDPAAPPPFGIFHVLPVFGASGVPLSDCG